MLDDEKILLKTALFEVAETGKANFIFTCNQNLILGDIKNEDKDTIDQILRKYLVTDHTDNASAIRRNAMACVALNTCPLALAEGQRYLPSLLSKIETMLERHGLQHEEIVIRMTGCPNGCARPFAAEIGFVGTAMGKYNLHIGGDSLGTRLNRIYKESLDEQSILSELDNLFAAFAKERNEGEKFGDFTNRKYFN